MRISGSDTTLTTNAMIAADQQDAVSGLGRVVKRPVIVPRPDGGRGQPCRSVTIWPDCTAAAILRSGRTARGRWPCGSAPRLHVVGEQRPQQGDAGGDADLGKGRCEVDAGSPCRLLRVARRRTGGGEGQRRVTGRPRRRPRSFPGCGWGPGRARVGARRIAAGSRPMMNQAAAPTSQPGGKTFSLFLAMVSMPAHEWR